MKTRKKNLTFIGAIPALIVPSIITYLQLKFYYYKYISILLVLLMIFLIAWPLTWSKICGIKISFLKKQKLLSSILTGSLTGLVIFTGFLILFILFKQIIISSGVQSIKFIDYKLLKKLFIPYVIYTCLGNTFIEEYYWRWFIINSLNTKINKISSLVIESLFFSIHHFIILFFIIPFAYALIIGILILICGFIWGLLYIKTSSILAGWISHSITVSFLMLIIYLILKSIP